MRLKCKKNRHAELRLQIGGSGADFFVLALGSTPGRDGFVFMCSAALPKKTAMRALRIGLVILTLGLGPALLKLQQDR